jgi:hypothetical protein
MALAGAVNGRGYAPSHARRKEATTWPRAKTLKRRATLILLATAAAILLALTGAAYALAAHGYLSFVNRPPGTGSTPDLPGS